MKLEKTYEGYKVKQRNKEIIIVPWTPARMMGFKEGEVECKPVSAEEPGLWVARSPEGMGPDTALVYEYEPIMAAGDWALPGLIRTFCWTTFARVTKIEVESGKAAKFAMVPSNA